MPPELRHVGESLETSNARFETALRGGFFLGGGEVQTQWFSCDYPASFPLEIALKRASGPERKVHLTGFDNIGKPLAFQYVMVGITLGPPSPRLDARFVGKTVSGFPNGIHPSELPSGHNNPRGARFRADFVLARPSGGWMEGLTVKNLDIPDAVWYVALLVFQRGGLGRTNAGEFTHTFLNQADLLRCNLTTVRRSGGFSSRKPNRPDRPCLLASVLRHVANIGLGFM